MSIKGPELKKLHPLMAESEKKTHTPMTRLQEKTEQLNSVLRHNSMNVMQQTSDSVL